MFEQILNYLVKHKIYTVISGMSLAGTELILLKPTPDVEIFSQKNVVFSPKMVKTILFHERGCTITLKH